MLTRPSLPERSRVPESIRMPSRKSRPATNAVHPLLQGPQSAIGYNLSSKTYLSEFTQRVMSGKLLQMKQTQNQLMALHKELHAALEDNRALNALLKKQEVALNRYEGEEADLPRLLRSHAEEVRSLRVTVRQLKIELRNVNTQLREKEQQITTLNESLASLRALAHEKQAFDKDKADKKIQELQGSIEELQKQNQLLSRQLLIERKNHQRQQATETSKLRETKKTLSEALSAVRVLESEKRAFQLATKPYTQNNVVQYPKILKPQPSLMEHRRSSNSSTANNTCRDLTSARFI